MYTLTNLKESKTLIPMKLQLFADSNQQNQSQQPNNYRDPAFQAKVQDFLNQQGQQAQPQQPQQQAQAQQQVQAQQQAQAQAQTQQQAAAAQEQGQAPDNQAATAQQQGQPQQQAPTPQEAMILGKFKSVDDLANSYQALQGMDTKINQENAQLKDSNAQLQQAIQNMQQQLQASQPPQGTDNATSNNGQFDQQGFMDKLYDNGQEAITSVVTPIIQSLIQQAINPLQQQVSPIVNTVTNIQKQNAWNGAISQFAKGTPDFENFRQDMMNIVGGQNFDNSQITPDVSKNVALLQSIYNQAKASKYVDPTSMLNNQDFVNQNVLNNQAIKDAVIAEYLKSVQSGQQPPVSIGVQSAGQTPLTPENRPKNMNEAKLAALRMFQGQ